jgi:N-acetylglucosamine kinase-like BadF-type ATPase
MRKQMKILIADSGSTKTDWAILEQGYDPKFVETQGMNPYHQDRETLETILLHELVPQVGDVDRVLFYGSGVRPELEPLMVEILRSAFPMSKVVQAHSDLLGAAVAVCGQNQGIACILGTGANSGLYDGCRILQNTPPLGYILGDEGSGAVLGTRFLNALLKGFLPDSLRELLFAHLQMTEADVIDRVYRKPLANRWLASLSPFIHAHLDVPGVRSLVIENFRDFFRRNLVQYEHRDWTVGAVGSMAWFYRAELVEAARLEGFTMGRIERSPIDGLVKNCVLSDM